MCIANPMLIKLSWWTFWYSNSPVGTRPSVGTFVKFPTDNHILYMFVIAHLSLVSHSMSLKTTPISPMMHICMANPSISPIAQGETNKESSARPRGVENVCFIQVLMSGQDLALHQMLTLHEMKALRKDIAPACCHKICFSHNEEIYYVYFSPMQLLCMSVRNNFPFSLCFTEIKM